MVLKGRSYHGDISPHSTTTPWEVTVTWVKRSNRKVIKESKEEVGTQYQGNSLAGINSPPSSTTVVSLNVLNRMGTGEWRVRVLAPEPPFPSSLNPTRTRSPRARSPTKPLGKFFGVRLLKETLFY